MLCPYCGHPLALLAGVLQCEDCEDYEGVNNATKGDT